MSGFEFDSNKFYLIYFEEHLEEWWETVDYTEYSRDELRWDWEKFIRIEEFDDLREAFHRAAELSSSVDYDYIIHFIGLFKGGKLLYGPKYIDRVIYELENSCQHSS